jgi:hypothetical protein
MTGKNHDLVEVLHVEAFPLPGFPDIEHRLLYLVLDGFSTLRWHSYLVAVEEAGDRSHLIPENARRCDAVRGSPPFHGSATYESLLCSPQCP